MGSVSETLAAFAVESRWGGLTAEVQREAKRALLNFVGCAAAVARDPAIDTAVGLLADYSGPATAGLIGRPERLDVLNASYVNAMAGNFLDYDDTHLETVIHPTAPIAPVALALAETHGFSGAEVLNALVLGMEIECRIGMGVSPGHYPRGWHITSTCGVFGAAAATARLLGLTAGQTAHALGIAASQSAGIIENLPTPAKNVSVGSAARNGIFAALMARAGYEAAPTAIEGIHGWARVSGDEPNIEAITGSLGSRWELLRNTYKPYPSGIVFHAEIEACLDLLREHEFSPEDVETVTVSGDSLFMARGDRTVANERDSRVSIHHSAAVALLFGRAGMAEFSLKATFDPRVVAMRGRVRAVQDDSIPRGAARVAVMLKDGRAFERTVIDALGGEARPLADDDIEAKTRQLVSDALGAPAAETVVAGVWGLEQASSVAPLMRTLAGG